MRRVAERLGSMGLATTTIAALLIWLSWGLYLSARQDLSSDFQAMTETFLRDWILSPLTGGLLKWWFIGLCLLMVLLGVNLIFCTWLRIFKTLRARFSGPRLLMLIVHMIFGLVALGHLAGFMVGYRHEGLRLGEGEAFQTSDGYQVKIERIQFVADTAALSRSAMRGAPPDIRDESNYAEVSLGSGGHVLARARTQLMEPMRYRDIQITLRGFHRAAPSGSTSPPSSEALEAIVVISKNPTLKVFLALYPHMIAGILGHLVLTWREKSASTVRPRES